MKILFLHLITQKASKTSKNNKHYQQAIITTILVFYFKIINKDII